MWLYINYPQPHFNIHRDPACQQIQIHDKPDQRTVTVRTNSLVAVLNDFITRRYRFAPQRALNDIWLDISLDTPE